MKYLLFALLLLPLSTLAQSPEAVENHEVEELMMDLDRILIDRLLALSRENYRGKAVQELLSSQQAQGYSDLKFRYTPEGQIDYLLVQYSPKVFLSIYVDDSSSIEQPLTHPEKALAQFRKEAISKVGVRFILLQEGGS